MSTDPYRGRPASKPVANTDTPNPLDFTLAPSRPPDEDPRAWLASEIHRLYQEHGRPVMLVALEVKRQMDAQGINIGLHKVKAVLRSLANGGGFTRQRGGSGLSRDNNSYFYRPADLQPALMAAMSPKPAQRKTRPATDPPLNSDRPATDPPLNSDRPATDPPLNSDRPATDPPLNSDRPATDPPLNSDRPATDPPLNSDRPATDPPLNSDRPATDPPLNSDRPATDPPLNSDRPATDPPLNSDRPATDPPLNSDRPATDPPLNSDRPATDPPLNSDRPATDPPLNSDRPATDPPLNSDRPATDPPLNSDRPATDPPLNCPEHGSVLMGILSRSGDIRCKARVPIDAAHSRGYCDWSPYVRTLTPNVNVPTENVERDVRNETPAREPEGIGEHGRSYLARYGRMPPGWEADPEGD